MAATEALRRRRPWMLGLTLVDSFVGLAYAAMLALIAPLHEPWPDEAQAWMLARDLGLRPLVFRYLRHEGHPALWYLILWVATHLFHLPYAGLVWLSCGIACGGIWVLLRFAPFPWYLRALLPFTFFLGYQYAVVARSYVLFPLLGFLAAHLFRSERPKPVALGVVLALLANVSVHGTLVAVALAVLYGLKQRRGQPAQTGRGMVLGGGIVAASVVFVAVCLWPTTGALPRVSPTLNRVIDALSVRDPNGMPPAGVLAAGAGPVGGATATAPPVGPRVEQGQAAPVNKGRLAAVPVVLRYGFARFTWLAVAFDCLLAVYLYRRGQFALTCPLLGLAAFLVFVYGAPWHMGLLWITTLMMVWIAWDTTQTVSGWSLQNAVGLALALLCVLQLPWTVGAMRFDAREATSPDQATAEYLKTLPAGTRIAGLGMAMGVQPYFERKLFFNQHLTFAYLSYDPLAITAQQTMEQRPDVVVTDPLQEAAVQQFGYRQTHRFCGTLYLPNMATDPGCLSVYEAPLRSGPAR